MADEWKTWSFRQKVIHQLEDLIRQSPQTQNRNAQELEMQVFQRSTKKEEYMQFIARVIMHLRDMAQSNTQQHNNPHLQAVLSAPGPASQMTGPAAQMSGPATQMTGPATQMTGPATQMTGPASQMTGPSTQMSGPASQMTGPGPHMTGTVTQMTAASGTMAGPVGPGTGQMVVTTGPVVTGPNTTILAGQQPMQGNLRMGQPMPPSMPNQPGDISNWPGNNRRVDKKSNMAMNQPVQPGTINAPGQTPKMGTYQMSISGAGGIQMGQMAPHQIVPNIGRGTGPMQSRVPSPGFLGSVGMPRQVGQSATIPSPVAHGAPGSQPSPAFIPPSPNTVPSPAGSAAGGMGRGGHIGAPSPGCSINTPGQPQQPSPVNQGVPSSQMEDAAYMEKVRQLSKYIDPLGRVIERMGNEDLEKSKKMKQLYDILQNPQRRMPMETLLKCEQVLVKLEIREDTGASATSTPPTMENRVSGLIDAVNNAFKQSWGSHTLNRTFSPALSVLLGPSYTSNRAKRFKRENPLQPPPETPNISDIVQGEVARLNARFRVNLDCQQPPGSDDLTLVCQLDDPNLPCVPPITLTVPSAYPMKTPRCDLLPVDYETTDFLKNIREIMLVRLKSMPPHCSLTMMLHNWEMSVRQACGPKPSLASIVNSAIASS